jgi:hypothetical protein
METFRKLFGSLLVFVYHCFDRIVIQGYLPLLTRPEHIVHFFRDAWDLSHHQASFGPADQRVPTVGRRCHSEGRRSRRGIDELIAATPHSPSRRAWLIAS